MRKQWTDRIPSITGQHTNMYREAVFQLTPMGYIALISGSGAPKVTLGGIICQVFLAPASPGVAPSCCDQLISALQGSWTSARWLTREAPTLNLCSSQKTLIPAVPRGILTLQNGQVLVYFAFSSSYAHCIEKFLFCFARS